MLKLSQQNFYQNQNFNYLVLYQNATTINLFAKQVVNFNIYSPNASSTSEKVFCNSSNLCDPNQCPSTNSDCVYTYPYLSNNTSTSGILVQDVLHLITDDDQSKVVNASITFG